MVAAVLREFGIDMGPGGLNHEDPSIVTLPAQQLQSYIDKRNQESRIWGFKFPGAHFDKRFSAVDLRNPIWILVFRNVVSNLDGMLARDGRLLQRLYKRIVDYYAAICDIINNEAASYVLVSYERAAAEPVRFAREIAGLLGMQLGEDVIGRAAQQVTGDGGGYLPPSHIFHSVQVVWPTRASNDLSINFNPLDRKRSVFRGVVIGFQDEKVNLQQDYTIQYKGGQGKTITVVLDFGEGFCSLASYDLTLTGDETLVRVQHEGAVQQIGFGTKGSELPLEVQILRYPNEDSK
jgi:hypothetical protein